MRSRISSADVSSVILTSEAMQADDLNQRNYHPRILSPLLKMPSKLPPYKSTKQVIFVPILSYKVQFLSNLQGQILDELLTKMLHPCRIAARPLISCLLGEPLAHD